jgi:hypothetical protein
VTVVDFWRCLPETVRNHPKIRYVPMGRCLDEDAAVKRLVGLWEGGSHAA